MSAPVARAFGCVWALQGQSFQGLRLKAIAQAVGQSEPTTLRDLNTLAEIGVVERIPGREEFWRLSPRLVQVAIAHAAEVARHQQTLSDFTQRYSRTP
jgi:DNA-binding IclR family transcriptional regulator